LYLALAVRQTDVESIDLIIIRPSDFAPSRRALNCAAGQLATQVEDLDTDDVTEVSEIHDTVDVNCADPFGLGKSYR